MEPISPTKSPYRDEKSTLAARLEKLHDELAGIQETRSQMNALAHREAEILAEMDRLAAQLARAHAKRQLPLMALAYVASPCKANWNEMVGDERTRFCKTCSKNVHNLSKMSFDEAELFLRQLTGDACVRLYRRTDGSIVTNDCPVGVRNKRMKRTAGALVGAGMAAAGIASTQTSTATSQNVAMGEIDVRRELPVQGGIGAIDPPLQTRHLGTFALPPPVKPPFTPPKLIEGPSTPENPMHVKGTITAQCTITLAGKTRDCEILGGPASMHQAMRHMLQQQTYQPAEFHGKPFAAKYPIRVELDSLPNQTSYTYSAGAAAAPATTGLSWPPNSQSTSTKP